MTTPRHVLIGDNAPPMRRALRCIAFAAALFLVGCGRPEPPPDAPTHHCLTTPHGLVECSSINAAPGGGAGR